MNPRDLIYLKPAGTADRLTGQLRPDGWRVHVVEHPAAVAPVLGQSGCAVGVVHLGEDAQWDADWAEACPTGVGHLKWVALVERAALGDAEVARLIGGLCFDYHTVPVEPERLALALGHAYGMARLAAHESVPTASCGTGEVQLLGRSAAIAQLNRDIRKVAATDIPVLITGESGTGKELAARSIHAHSMRRHAPFVAINCGALPRELIQSELFGHERGAFTGASTRRIGRIESADSGTLFLDEVGDLPLEQQVNLLRFLQEHTIQRLGGHEDLPVDVRVIAATNVDLERAVNEGRFREDLYYRLNVVSVRTPPLREHPEDIEPLAELFLHRFTRDACAAPKVFNRQALRVMMQHTWPGNVRELINRVRRAVVMSEGRIISPDHLGLERHTIRSHVPTLQEAKARAEKEAVERALRCSAYNVSEAARQLGVSRVTLYTLLRKYRIASEPAALASC